MSDFSTTSSLALDLPHQLIPLKEAASGQAYLAWLQQGHQGDLAYMAEDQEARLKPQVAFAPFRSVLVVTCDYLPHPKARPIFPEARVALYAQGEDYHHWFKSRLQEIADQLKQQYPHEDFKTFTDAVPLLERDLGWQARLGWIGKNTCLIHPQRGSLFFIGEILTTLQVPALDTPPLHDFCGKCTACLDACPTGALHRERRELDARLCISHWNIESRQIPPRELRPAMGDWLFGCDICQTVCPWNLKAHKGQLLQGVKPSPLALSQELGGILRQSNKALDKMIKGTPLSRAGGKGLKRNALIVIGNLRLKELRPEVESYTALPYFSELAQWTLEQLNSP